MQKKRHCKDLKCPFRYIKRKIESAYKKLVKKEPRKTAKVVYNKETLKRKSINESKEIAQLRGIKNRGKLKKGLITSLLKSEISNAERNYMKYFNTNDSNNTNASNNVGNNTIVSNNTNDDTYDGKIRNIRAMLSRSGDIVTNDDRVKIRKDLHEMKIRKTF